jgi:hypothetical protein
MGLTADFCIQFLIFLFILPGAHKICNISIKIYISGKFVELTLVKSPIYISGTKVKAAFLPAQGLRMRNFLSIRCLTA